MESDGRLMNVGYDTLMRASPMFVVVVFHATLATAQSSVDPYEFANKKDLHNAEVNQLWRTLGISGKVRETTADGPKETKRNFNCGEDNRCEARLFSSAWSLLGADGYDTVVRISPAYLDSNLSRFLVFHYGQGGGWRLVDYLDLTEWDYDFPEVSAVNSGGKRWLVVKAWPHCGTGCSLIHTDWFELKNGKLRMVLTVPLSGHQGNENPGRQFETRFVRASQSQGRETLEFVYHVKFGSGFRSSIEAVDLWDDEKVIRFSRPNGQIEFRFDAKSSEASEAFVKKIFASLEVGQFQLLTLVEDRLMEIARGPKNQRHEWLGDLLEQNASPPELARVREAFNKAK